MNYIPFTRGNGRTLSVPTETKDIYDQAYQQGKKLADAKHSIAWLLANIEHISTTYPHSEAGQACRKLVNDYDSEQKRKETK
jgi:hypothetical protein